MKVNSNNAKHNLTATISSLSHDGRGIATVANKTTFISGALANEVVNFQLTKKHERYNEAIVTDIITASTDRTSPICPHFGVCGGCSLQHLNDDLQVVLKQQTLLEQLKHFGQVTPDHILPPLLASSTGYRRKARLGVKFVIKKNKVLVGFREKFSRYLADLSSCQTLHPSVGLKLTQLSDLVASLSIQQAIPQIEVAVGDTEVALVFRHLVNFTLEDRDKLTHFAEQEKMQIYLQPNPPERITKLFPADDQHHLRYSLPAQQVEFLFHPLDFTQINLELNRNMVNQAIKLLELESKDVLLDLFCGIGNFSLAMAKYVSHVIGIEGEQTMIHRATANAIHNKLSNVSFYQANLFSPIPDASWMKKHYHKIVLDPPRSGAKEILPYLSQFNAAKILYVSCNSATLARDAGILVKTHGYRLTHAGIMNMFPHTSHSEAIALFEKT